MNLPEEIVQVKPAFRWSFSQWETYQSCPAKWKFQNILKLPRQPPGPAAARGLDLHARVEDYITHKTDTLEPPVGVTYGGRPPARVDRRYIPILDAYRNHPNGDVHVEKKLAFDHEWYLCPPKSQYAACIAVLDAVRFFRPHAVDKGILHVGEWKSGKPKDTHGDQRKLYAMFGMRAWMADEVEVTTYYLEGTAEPQRLALKSTSGFDKLKQMWQERMELMQRDTICAPRPSFGCNWCDFSKAKGGPCIF